jgi:hypothetical protein
MIVIVAIIAMEADKHASVKSIRFDAAIPHKNGRFMFTTGDQRGHSRMV